MRYLRQNTAVRITVGPFFDKTDGITPETGLTVTNCKLTFMVDDDDNSAANLIIDASATASGGNNDMIHVSGDDAGFYDLELTQAQTNYVGRAMLAITDAANHCPVFHEFMIVPANVYDSLFGTDKLYVDVSEISSDSTAADNCESMFDGTGYVGGTAKLTVDVVKISGDATAADNEESFFDGTGYAGTNNVIPTVIASGLSDDAITASKFDESTAFPIKSADTGATIIARPGDKMDIVDAPSSTGVLAIVDAFLTRAFGSVTYTGTTRCVLTALQKLRNKVANSGGIQTVYKENDSTASYTSTITTDADADPVISIDPDS